MKKKFVEVAKIQNDADWSSTHISLELNTSERMLCQAWVKAFRALMATLREHSWVLAMNELEEYSVVNENLDELPVRIRVTEYTIGNENPLPKTVFSLRFKDLMRLEVKLVAYLQKNPL